MITRCSFLICWLISSAGFVWGEEQHTNTGDAAQHVAFFESSIRPVLVKHCYECHSQASGAAEGGLELDSRISIREGGSRGPAVVPFQPEESLLLTAISHQDPGYQMPPQAKPLNAAVIANFRKWIELGASDPREKSAQPLLTSAMWEKAQSHWAYQPVQTPELPEVQKKAWPRQPLDHFVLAQLEDRQLAPSPEAAPEVLLRRIYFDLTGLPPDLAAQTNFLHAIKKEGMERAWSTVVDRLLASPQYGERWGRHWLDVVRFAESSGHEANISFPDAWRFRDYMIDAVTADLPWNQIIREQLAGDLLPASSEKERARLLIATSFLAVGPKNLDADNEKQFEADLIDEQIDTISRAFLAQSIACARCHHHKQEPYSMEDYYALSGIFASTKTYFGTAISPSNRIGGDPLELPQLPEQQIFHRSIPEKRLAQMREEWDALSVEKAEMEAAQKALLAGAKPAKEFTLTDALRIFWRMGALEGEFERVDQHGKALPLTMGVQDRKSIQNSPLLERGEVSRPGQLISRRFPTLFQELNAPEIPDDQSGRLQLADWLTSPRHPLTARVLVNRVWQHLLGAGLVRTVDNFGLTGDSPSHPELLDHLTQRFLEQNWSLKQLIREIVLSSTYRQSSAFREDLWVLDPENRWLGRFSKRRLEAEAIRDAILSVSGQLETVRPAGSLVARVIQSGPISLIGLNSQVPADLDGSVHRSVYLPVLRDHLPDVLELFDFAEPSLVTGEREVTNVPAQALYLMNSPFVLQQAEFFAVRLEEFTTDPAEQVTVAFRLSLGRFPNEAEQLRSLQFLQRPTPSEDGHQLLSLERDERLRQQRVLFCQALLVTGEFRYLD